MSPVGDYGRRARWLAEVTTAASVPCPGCGRMPQVTQPLVLVEVRGLPAVWWHERCRERVTGR